MAAHWRARLEDGGAPGTAMTASSTSPSTSAIERTVGRPATSPPRALTRCSGPEKPAGEQVAHDLAADGPGPARRADDRDRGGPQDVRDRRDVGGALALLEALPRLPRQRRRELDLDRVRRPGGRRPGSPESWNTCEHAVVARQHGRRERLDALRRRGLGEMGEQDGRDPVALPRIGDREGDLRPLGGPPM